MPVQLAFLQSLSPLHPARHPSVLCENEWLVKNEWVMWEVLLWKERPTLLTTGASNSMWWSSVRSMQSVHRVKARHSITAEGPFIKQSSIGKARWPTVWRRRGQAYSQRTSAMTWPNPGWGRQGRPSTTGPRAGYRTEPGRALFGIIRALMWAVGSSTVCCNGLTFLFLPPFLGFFCTTYLQKGRRVVLGSENEACVGEAQRMDNLWL